MPPSRPPPGVPFAFQCHPTQPLLTGGKWPFLLAAAALGVACGAIWPRLWGPPPFQPQLQPRRRPPRPPPLPFPHPLPRATLRRSMILVDGDFQSLFLAIKGGDTVASEERFNPSSSPSTMARRKPPLPPVRRGGVGATLYGEGGGGDAGRWGGDDVAGRSRGEPDKVAMMLATVARRGDGSGCGVARGGSRWRRRWTEVDD
ncbi:hypothetical protein MUK42_34574 [Musa troglodytarum]|uniref:Uncharacterized protein n=1 Tax=Musa troglodytarum TaxID=320322 RepID=A0A9E7EFG5_9LILI|nr:hypothetical protein MUK42_34574 [Musa troglodytarum]